MNGLSAASPLREPSNWRKETMVFNDMQPAIDRTRA